MMHLVKRGTEREGDEMKQKIVYVCERCGYESQDKYKIFEHEATHHLGLTVPEAQEYCELKAWVNMVASAYERNNSQDARYMYNMAIQDLLCFEKKHGIMNLE